jgi:hypothetical protein
LAPNQAANGPIPVTSAKDVVEIAVQRTTSLVNVDSRVMQASHSSAEQDIDASSKVSGAEKAGAEEIIPDATAALSQDSGYGVGDLRQRPSLHAETSGHIDGDDSNFSILQMFDLSFPPPLGRLFSEGADSFTRQQKKIIVDMYELLRNGVDAIKHGRGGKSHQRFLYCDESLTTIFWRAAVRK